MTNDFKHKSMAAEAREFFKLSQELEPGASMSCDKATGLYRKFRVERTDGSSAPGGKHENCRYFVLDINHDQFSVPALEAYAAACQSEYPVLAAELRALVYPPSPGDDDQSVSIVVNGTKHTHPHRLVSYGDVLAYAGYGPERIISVTYRNGEKDGILPPGRTVSALPGAQFEACDTSNA